jgi:RNA polymerase-associated protein CTR9
MAATNGHVPRSRTIEVPLQHEQVLEVVCEDLPANPIELTDIFSQESVGLLYYRLLAVSVNCQLYSRNQPLANTHLL